MPLTFVLWPCSCQFSNMPLPSGDKLLLGPPKHITRGSERNQVIMVSLVAWSLVFHDVALPLPRPANMPEVIFQMMKPWHILSPTPGFCVVIATGAYHKCQRASFTINTLMPWDLPSSISQPAGLLTSQPGPASETFPGLDPEASSHLCDSVVKAVFLRVKYAVSRT